eukprot:s3522_g3.t1
MPWRYVLSSSSDGDESDSSSSSSEEETQLNNHQKSYLEIGNLFLSRSGLGQWMDDFPGDFTFASDCSGADTAWQALEMLFEAGGKKNCLRYLSASEIHGQKRRFLRENFECKKLVDDLFKNNVSWLMNHLCCYICGFPCTPYSFLHVGTQLLQDPNARQLFRILRNCRRLRPAIILLENVMGFARVLDRVLSLIRRNLDGYECAVVRLSPTQFGAPLSRKRLYFFLIRNDVLVDGAQGERFEQCILAGLSSLRMDVETTWDTLLLPNDDPFVQADIYRRHKLQQKNRQTPVNPNARWIARHQAWAEERQVNIGQTAGLFASRYPQAALSVSTRREMQALNLLVQYKQEVALADTSQNLGSLPNIATKNSPVMCLTPQGRFMSLLHQRYLLGREVCLLQGMPVHRLKLSSFSENVLQSLGGNSMHMRCIMAAICASLKVVSPQKLYTSLDLDLLF